MGWGFGRIEQRVAVPDVQHVVQSQVRMLEQVSCLPIDLERLGIIERVEVEQITERVYYKRLHAVASCSEGTS